MSSIAELLKVRPQDLLVPTSDVKERSLQDVKALLDPIASEFSIFDEVHVDGLDAEQVWAQVQMVIDGALESLLDKIPESSLKRKRSDESDDEEEDSEDDSEDAFDQEVDGDEQDIDEMDDALNGSKAVDEDDDDDEDDGELEFEGADDYDTLVEGDADADEDEESDGTAGEDDSQKPKSELDEGLFRLEDFQQQVLALEQNDAAEEEENINYFGSIEEQDSESDGDMHYNDFFAAPKGSKRSKRPRPFKKPAQHEELEDDFEGLGEDANYESIEAAMSSARKDLFSDDEEQEIPEAGENLSTFEKQQREIMKQIRELEQENVGNKGWAVKGEVKARDRPLDSLVATELDFERNSKPVPVITQEVTESLEDMIRRRIKADDFDDLPRRLPDTLPEFKRSKLVDVQETKSQQSLAELYEEDYVKQANPDTYQSAESEKLNAAHQEIRDMFAVVSRKLDALSSWNYTPKAPKPSISIVTNAPALSMEEAQPTAMATESMLAPQEIYKTTASSNREVVKTNGIAVAKAEMTREERARDKRKQKTKRAKIMHEREVKRKGMAAKDNSRAAITETLRKGNVTIIGKGGEKRDVSGKLVKEKARPAASNLKL